MRIVRPERSRNVLKLVYVNVRRKYNEHCHHLSGNVKKNGNNIRKTRLFNCSMLS